MGREVVGNRLTAIVGAILVLPSLAGCSSSPPPVPLLHGELPRGTAHVTIGNDAMATTYAVGCTTEEFTTSITSGHHSAGVTAVVDYADKLSVKSVSIANFGGFTGSYWENLQGNAHVDMIGSTYAITGIADGFNADKPSTKTSTRFAIRVAC